MFLSVCCHSFPSFGRSSLFQITFLGVMLTSIYSCSVKEEKPPVPYERMVPILKDIQMLEAYTLLQTFPDTNKTITLINSRNADTLVKYYRAILSHHKMEAPLFFAAIDWYMAHPSHMDSVQKRLLPELSSQEGKLLQPLK